ncbi:MAG TPA: DUF4337 domain-containing protein [Roseateles sp.]
MDLDPQELIDRAAEAGRQASAARLNAAVAVTVAVLATFMGICKVKDDNIVQAMQQAQADKLDHWAYYQSRTLRADVAESAATQLELAKAGAPAAQALAYDQAIASYRTKAADQARKRDELKAQAEADQQTYDSLNYRDDQFDLSDALLAIAIALLAVTALTRLWPLFFAAMVPTFFGVVMGVAGLAALHIHPDALVKLLS